MKRVTEARATKNTRQGRFSLEWLHLLNGRSYSPHIARLLEEISSVNRLDASHRESDDHWIRPSAEMREISRLQKSIKASLERYAMIPTFRIGPDGWVHTFDRPAGAEGQRKRDYVVLSAMHEMCEAGLLPKLSRCDYPNCLKWFLRRVCGQRFHSAKCREKAFKSTLEWKAYRAKKAREYYWLHKRKNIK